jgi:hypothetical protein
MKKGIKEHFAGKRKHMSGVGITAGHSNKHRSQKHAKK